MQREPLLLYKPPKAVESKNEASKESYIDQFLELDATAKTVVLLLAFAAVMIITLIVLLIVKAHIRRKGVSGDGTSDEFDFSSIQDEYADEGEARDAAPLSAPVGGENAKSDEDGF